MKKLEGKLAGILVVSFSLFSYMYQVFHSLIIEKTYSDFALHYNYAMLLLFEKQNIYLNPERFYNILSQKMLPGFFIGEPMYHPFVYIIAGFFTLFNFSVALTLWSLLSNIFLLAIFYMLLKLTDTSLNDWFSIGFLSFIMLSSYPLIENIRLGQMNILILLLLCMALLFYKYKAIPLTPFIKGGIVRVVSPFEKGGWRGILTGVFLVLAGIIKAQFLVLFVFFLLKKQYKIVLTGIFMYIFLTVVSGFIIGWDIQMAYFTSLLNLGTRYLSHINLTGNLSVWGALNRIFSENQLLVKIIGISASLVLFVSSLANIKRNKKDFDLDFLLEFSLFLTFVIIVSPLTESHHLFILLLPFFIIYKTITHIQENKLFDNGLGSDINHKIIVLYAISFLLVNLKYSFSTVTFLHSGVFSLFYNMKLYGCIILFILLINLCRKMNKFINTKS